MDMVERVWVVARNYGYDGYGAPEHAFSSKALADAFVAANEGWNGLEAFELPIDPILKSTRETA